MIKELFPEKPPSHIPDLKESLENGCEYFSVLEDRKVESIFQNRRGIACELSQLKEGTILLGVYRIVSVSEITLPIAIKRMGESFYFRYVPLSCVEEIEGGRICKIERLG